MLILVLRVSVVRADAPMILQTFLSRLQNGNADPAINSCSPSSSLPSPLPSNFFSSKHLWNANECQFMLGSLQPRLTLQKRGTTGALAR